MSLKHACLPISPLRRACKDNDVSGICSSPCAGLHNLWISAVQSASICPQRAAGARPFGRHLLLQKAPLSPPTKNIANLIACFNFSLYLHPLLAKRAISSAGLEHLPYKQGVVGSNPTSPTKKIRLHQEAFFFARTKRPSTSLSFFGWAKKSQPARRADYSE